MAQVESVDQLPVMLLMRRSILRSRVTYGVYNLPYAFTNLIFSHRGARRFAVGRADAHRPAARPRGGYRRLVAARRALGAVRLVGECLAKRRRVRRIEPPRARCLARDACGGYSRSQSRRQS